MGRAVSGHGWQGGLRVHRFGLVGTGPQQPQSIDRMGRWVKHRPRLPSEPLIDCTEHLGALPRAGSSQLGLPAEPAEQLGRLTRIRARRGLSLL